MKFIHTSDWHLGQSFYNFSKEEEHLHFFAQMAEIVTKEKPDALLVSGDIFHIPTPSSQAQKLFVEGILKIHNCHPQMKIIVTAGNHDSFSLLETHRDLWQTENVTIIGFPEYDPSGEVVVHEKLITEVSDEYGLPQGYVIAVPYIRPSRYYIFKNLLEEVKKINKHNLPVIMMAHLTVNGSSIIGQENIIGGIDGIDYSDFGESYDYLALGHIHTPQFIKGTNRKARYSGTPIQTSFDEMFPHSVTLVEIHKHNEIPIINEIEIDNNKKYITYPKEPKSFDEIEKDLCFFNPDIEGFLRLNVLVENILPIDAETRIYEILKEKKIKLCQIITHSHKEAGTTEQPALNAKKLKEQNPLEVARLFYLNKYGSEMPQELQTLFEEVQHEIKMQQ